MNVMNTARSLAPPSSETTANESNFIYLVCRRRGLGVALQFAASPLTPAAGPIHFLSRPAPKSVGAEPMQTSGELHNNASSAAWAAQCKPAR